MAWVAVDEDGDEAIFEECPRRWKPANANGYWLPNEEGFPPPGCGEGIDLPRGIIYRMTGRSLTWKDNPFELKEVDRNDIEWIRGKVLGGESLKRLITDLKELSLRSHYYCEDDWDSCPKAPGGCADDSQGDDCNCGADSHNQRVEELYKLIVEK